MRGDLLQVVARGIAFQFGLLQPRADIDDFGERVDRMQAWIQRFGLYLAKNGDDTSWPAGILARGAKV